MEAVMKASSDIKEAIVFGANRPAICALVFMSSDFRQLYEEDKEAAWKKTEPTIVEANKTAPSYAQLAKEMVAFVADSTQLPLSSKGSVQKPMAAKAYAGLIDSLYVDTASNVDRRTFEDTGKLAIAIREIVLSTMTSSSSKKLKDDTDLFAAGVDSIQAARIRQQIIAGIELGSVKLPTNVVFEHPTIELYV